MVLPTGIKEGIRPNDRLIANLIPVVMSVGLPFIIAGDFNEPLVKLPAYNFFQDLFICVGILLFAD